MQSAEASKVCKFTCPHSNGGYKFLTKRGMLVHARRCEWKEEFEMERILDCKGETGMESRAFERLLQ